MCFKKNKREEEKESSVDDASKAMGCDSDGS